jgi:hypothetical protein
MKKGVKFTLEHATKAQRGNRGTDVLFNFGARWGWVVIATTRPLYPFEWPGTHCTGDRVGPTAGLDGCGKTRPHRDSISEPSNL